VTKSCGTGGGREIHPEVPAKLNVGSCKVLGIIEAPLRQIKDILASKRARISELRVQPTR